MLLIPYALRHLLVQYNGLLEHGLEGSEIALRPGLRPDVLSDRAYLGPLVHQGCRNTEVILDRLPHLSADRPFHAVRSEIGGLCFGLLQKPPGLVRHEVVPGHNGQGSQLLRPCARSPGRHHGLRVPTEDRLRVEEIINLPQALQKSAVSHAFGLLKPVGVTGLHRAQGHGSL